jgi:uncharacterized membrane protein
MKKILKIALKLIILFIIGAFVYMGIEIAFRGFTHWTMGIVGGLCFVLIGGLNEYFGWDMPFWKQCLIGAVIVTTLELAAGLLLNEVLGLGIWDYSAMPLNFMGQICLPFSIAWFFLSGVAVVIDDWLRYFLFHEEKPHYKFF